MIKEKSCGAVIYKIIDNQVYFLVEKMQRGHYALTKGHVENNETEVETATREIKEETNLDVIIDTNFREVISYSPYEGCIKDVVYFIAKATSDDIKASIAKNGVTGKLNKNDTDEFVYSAKSYKPTTN